MTATKTATNMTTTALHMVAIARAARRHFGQSVTIRNGEVFDNLGSRIGVCAYRYNSELPWLEDFRTGERYTWASWQSALAGDAPGKTIDGLRVSPVRY